MAAGMPDPNNVLLHDRKLAFMCIAKAGNTSIKYAICEWLGIEGNPHRVLECGPVPDGYFAIAFVRNPFTRILSCYQNKIIDKWLPSLARFGMSQGMPLDEFINCVCTTTDQEATGSGQHFRSQYFDLQERPDFLGHVETLMEDWERLQVVLPGLPSIGKENSSHADQFTLTSAQKSKLHGRFYEDWWYF